MISGGLSLCEQETEKLLTFRDGSFEKATTASRLPPPATPTIAANLRDNVRKRITQCWAITTLPVTT